MNFLGIGGLEFLLIFGVAMFFLGPKRLALGVREGRKYYRELRKYRQELTGMVKEAIDADELKKELEQTKKDAWDESMTQEIASIGDDLQLDDETLDIPELDVTRSVPNERGSGSALSAAIAAEDEADVSRDTIESPAAEDAADSSEAGPAPGSEIADAAGEPEPARSVDAPKSGEEPKRTESSS